MNDLFQIKVCGITRPVDALAACFAGADAVGLNFYRKSPRFLESKTALEISEAVDKFCFAQNRKVVKVGVFVNEFPDQVAQIAEALLLDAIQFHGDEQPDVIPATRLALSARDRPIWFIRAIRTQSESPAQTSSHAENSPGRRPVQSEIESWVAEGADAILLDAAAPRQYGGTGLTVDWHFVAELDRPVALILAGGLNPENVAEAIRISKVSSVDVASGVESSPGIKDQEKINAFVESAKRAFG